MNFSDITLLLGVDAKHLQELRLVWPDWMRHKPELRAMRCVVFYDASEAKAEELDFLNEHPKLDFLPWDLPAARNQREKMLTGFVHMAAREVRTTWYLKIDTDVIATESGEWIKEEWFAPHGQGELPVFIASPWGYTKPRYTIDVLDDWADKVLPLSTHPRLNVPYSTESKSAKHSRIISWLFFGNTAWTREIAALLPVDGRLPVPSQDTFLFYCAERLGKHYRKVKMSSYGWKHCKLSQPSQQAIAPPTQVSLSQHPGGSRGVIYYNTGTSCAVRLLVSLHSLRQHYGGPVTILTEGEESNALCEKIGAALGAEVKRWDCGVPPGPNRPYLAKTRYHLGSPYELTVALDSDTLVVGGIDELFQLAAEHSFCVAQLAQWKTRGKIIGGRIRQWQKALPEWIQDALNFGPAINCGVVAFHKDARLCADWLDHALKGREYFIPDEVSCQLMLPRYPHHILDGCWNRSCKHDDPSLPETRIIHYHGRKHCRAELPYHGDKWAMAYDEVMRQNLAGVRTWTPAGDRQLARHMKACQKERNKPTQHSASSSPVYETELWCPRGHLNEDQADKYAEICARVRPRYVLETGFCTGRSAACVLHYSTAIERMVSIDINLDYNAQHGRRMAALLKGRFPAWDVLEESSRVILTATFFRERFPQGIDLATIDGDHSYEGCLFDLEAVSPHLTERGVMIVDDYQSGPPNGMRIESVTRSVDDFLNKHANAFVGERWYKRGKGFCIIRRI